MRHPDYKQAVIAFGNYHPGLPDFQQGFEEFTVTALSGGLIHKTYKVESQLSIPFLLQKINPDVFEVPEDVQENYIHLSEYAEFEFTGLRLPYPQHCNESNYLFKDKNGACWRAMEFIGNTKTLTIAEKPSQAKAVAKAFAKFTASYNEFNIDMLKETIPGFHDLSLRFKQFEDSLGGEQYERMHKALSLIDELRKRERYKFFYEEITDSDKFPKRVMHHDAKIANILFSKTTGKVICAVDLDTTMPGYFFSDLGDMIRSMACSADECSTNFEKIKIRKNYYDAIMEGYLSVMQKQLMAIEKKYIHYAGLLMSYMQALRFLTDYLNGDIYYHRQYREQNFDRAKNQLTLLQSLEEFLKEEHNLKT